MEKLLNELLSDVIVESHKMQNYHWYIKGKSFYPMHKQMEEFYHEFIDMSDEIAEVMLMMGYKPVANLKDMLNLAHIKELRSQYIEDRIVYEGLVIDFKYLLHNMKNIKSLADETENDIIVTKIDEFIYMISKHLWMILATSESNSII